MSTHSLYAVSSESSTRIQYGRHSLSIRPKDGSNDVLVIVSNGNTEQVFDMSSFIVTPFLPNGTELPYPYPTDNGVIIDTMTLIQCLQSMGQFVFNSYTKLMMNDGAIALISGSIKDLETITSGFNTSGTELTVTKLNGYNFYSGTSGSGIPAAPWLVGVKNDGVCEVGRIIDFHTDYVAGGTDYTCRVTCTGNSLSIPNISVPGSINVTGNVTSANITTLTNRITAEETKSIDFETRIANEETKSVSIDLRLTEEETNSALMRIDINAMDDRLIEEETKSTDFETRIANEELKSVSIDTRLTTAEGTITSHGTRLTTAEGTITSHGSRLGAVEGSATAINNRITRIMGAYYYPNGYDDPNNSDFRTLEWVVDYMLKNIIPTLGDLEGSNTLQSWLIGIFGAASFAEGIASAAVIKQINATLVVHGTQLAAHAMTLEANLITMSAIEVDIAAIKASVALTAGQVLGLMILGGSVGVGLYALINRGNGPMKQSTVPDKYEPIINDTEPIALIGYTDPIARIVEGSAYELVDSRLIKFDGSDAKIVPIKLKVEEIEATKLNGITITEYATNATLLNYVTNTSLTTILWSYATKTKVDNISAKVTVIESDYITSTILATTLNNYVTNTSLTTTLNNYVTNTSLTTTLNNYVTNTSLVDYVTNTSLTTTLNNYVTNTSLVDYVTNSSLTTLANRVTPLETKTTSLSYVAAATTISNALRLPGGISIDPTNAIVYYGSNMRIEKWCVAPWSSHVNDALILIDHINTTAYGNEVRMLCGRIDLFRHPGAWSHGVYIDITLIHFGIETVPQISNINYVSYNTDGTEPHAREPRLALVTHTASSKQYIAIHVPFYVNSGRVHFSGIMSSLTDSIPMLMCLPSDGYTIDQSPYDTYARKQEWNHGLRCIGNIEAPNVVAVENKVSGFNTNGTELTLTKLNGLSMNDYITDGALQFLLNGYVPLDTLSDYATTSSLATVETKTSRLTYTSAMDLLTVSSSMRLSKTLSVNGTAEDTISISCPNGTIIATNINVTNKDDIDALQTKTSGFNADGTELTVTKLNNLSMSDYSLNSSLTPLTNKTSGFNSDGTELTLTKLNGYALYSSTMGSGIPAAPWIVGVKTDGVCEVGRMIDFHTDYETGGTDNTCRVSCSGNSLTIPNISVPGSVSVVGTVTSANITTLETKTTGLSYSGGTTVFNAVPKIGNESLIDFFYPIGSLYQSSDNTFNPNTKWGGTWLKIEGRFILGSNSTKSVGDTGGNEKVTIEHRHLPDHTHPYTIHSCTFIEEKIQSITNTSRLYANGASTPTGDTGGWKATSQIDQLDIMPPYEVVNIWKRTA